MSAQKPGADPTRVTLVVVRREERKPWDGNRRTIRHSSLRLSEETW
jgi:hypothetical protein